MVSRDYGQESQGFVMPGQKARSAVFAPDVPGGVDGDVSLTG
jgi:hypothetical protein